MIKIAVFCPTGHPTFNLWRTFCQGYAFHLISSVEDIQDDVDFLFLTSCTEILSKEVVGKPGLVCVLHESDLPKGRGWSPLAWQVLEGKNRITVSAILCAESVDSGDILEQDIIVLEGNELSLEINEKAFWVKASLIHRVIAGNEGIPQIGEPTYYKRRTPADSEIDPHKTIAEQFDLLRICEPRFPAYFKHRGRRFELTIK